MTYTINKSDGTILTTVIDSTIDQTTDLSLIGRNYSGFGQQINQNLVYLLENFANTSPPARPQTGQLWFDSSVGENRLKVYSSAGGWKAANGTVVSSTTPLTLAAGDLWLDNNEQQFYAFDGLNPILVGPTWGKNQGITGVVARSILDDSGNTRHVLYLYVHDILLGIFSADEFTPKDEIENGGIATIIKGFNSNSNINFTFNTTVENSLRLNSLQSTQFLRSDVDTVSQGKITIANVSGKGLTISSNATVEMSIPAPGTTFILENKTNNGNIHFKTNTNTATYSPLFIDSTNNKIGIYNTTPAETVDITGNLKVSGNIIVGGADTAPISLTVVDSTTTTLTNTNLQTLIDDVFTASADFDGKEAYLHIQTIDFGAGTITRTRKLFQIVSGAWAYQSTLTNHV